MRYRLHVTILFQVGKNEFTEDFESSSRSLAILRSRDLAVNMYLQHCGLAGCTFKATLHRVIVRGRYNRTLHVWEMRSRKPEDLENLVETRGDKVYKRRR